MFFLQFTKRNKWPSGATIFEWDRERWTGPAEQDFRRPAAPQLPLLLFRRVNKLKGTISVSAERRGIVKREERAIEVQILASDFFVMK
jgi:hypothetical protein